jgi:hypothetical protein
MSTDEINELARRIAEDDAVATATRRAAQALRAWAGFPPAASAAYPGERRRLARRAAVAVAAMLAAARRSADGQ